MIWDCYVGIMLMMFYFAWALKWLQRPAGAPMSTLVTYEVAFCMRARVPPRLPILRSYVAVLDNRVPASTTNSKVRIHVSRLNLKLPKNDPSLSSSVHHVIADRTEDHHTGDVLEQP